MMSGSSVYKTMQEATLTQGGCFFLLIDPDSVSEQSYIALAESAETCGVDGLLVGSSLMRTDRFAHAMQAIRAVTTLPVIIFPGSYAQINPHADAVLFTSLISGRNAQYLIDEQVKGAPLVRLHKLETIPTGYMLIESGPLTSVQYISGTLPIPRQKHDIATAHAMAAECLGMKLVYLEAGSGASQPVPVEMVRAVSAGVQIPVMVGGGLCRPEECSERIEAGASIIVVGNRFEKEYSRDHLRELVAASHPKEVITA